MEKYKEQPLNFNSKDQKSVEKAFAKHEATIHVTHNLSPFARHLWNILTNYFYDDLHTEQTFSIDLSKLCKIANYNSRNKIPIKKALKILVSSSIEWVRYNSAQSRVIDEEWATSSYLASAEIKKGILTVDYSSWLKQHILEPKHFTLLNVSVLRSLPKDKSYVFYENVAGYVKNKNFPGLTPRWSLSCFRLLMGAKAPTYDNFKYLNNLIIKPSIKKVMALTNLNIRLLIHKRGKTVTHVQFEVTYKSIKNIIVDRESTNLSISQSLTRYGITRDEAKSTLNDFPDQYIRHCINKLEDQFSKANPIRDAGDYLMAIINNNTNHYTNIRKLNEGHKSKKLKENLLEDEHDRKLKITSYIEKITNDDFERLKALFLDEFSHYNIHALNDHWEKRFFSHTTYSLLWIEFVENMIQS